MTHLRAVAWVVGAELRQTARDPHVAVFLLFPILFYPLVMWASIQVLMVVEGQDQHALWRIDAEGPPEVLDAVFERGVPVTGGSEALRDGRADLVVRTTTDGQVWTVHVEYAGVRTRSRNARQQVGESLVQLRIRRVDAVAAAHDIPDWELLAHPIRIEVESTPRQVVDRIAAILLAVLVPIALVFAGLYPAVDLAVSEREKGTIETMLSSAAPRLAVLAGRLATCVLLMVAGAAGNALGMALTANHVAASVTGDTSLVWIPPASVLLGIPVVAATAVLVAAIYFLALVPARTFKEGEYAATYAMLLLMPPIFAAVPVLVGNTEPGLLAWVPPSNALVALRDAAAGTPDAVQVVATLATNLSVAAVLVVVTARVTASEAFLFGAQLPRWLAWVRRVAP